MVLVSPPSGPVPGSYHVRARPRQHCVGLRSIVTVLSPQERSAVDAAGEGLYSTVHRDSVEEIIPDLREQRASAILLSVVRCGSDELAVSYIGRITREFPRIPAVALLSRVDLTTPHAVLSLGHSGVGSVIDVCAPGGWRQLRDALQLDSFSDIERRALGLLVLDLIGASRGCWRFFEAVFEDKIGLSTIRQLALRLHVVPSTLMSRFFRASLPAPKRYLAFARLARAARVFENPGLSVANVANHLEYSSPQSFGRHVRTLLGLTAVQFRQHYDGEGMLERFREELILPYLPALRRFNPLGSTRSWAR